MLLAARPVTGFIWRPDALSWIVAFLAGVAGMLADVGEVRRPHRRAHLRDHGSGRRERGGGRPLRPTETVVKRVAVVDG
jgi:hypothetical protein